MHFIALSGSLRQASYNTALLRNAAQLLPAGVSMTVLTLEQLPLLNPDTLADGFPHQVNDLAERIQTADGLVLASPEFNYSVTAAMKNAIDWLSIHPLAPLKNKPTAILSTSPSAFGGARAQYQLRQMLIYPDAKLLNQPEVMVANATERFNQQGDLTDPASRELIEKQMQALLQLAQGQ
jgi:chromate reductase